MLHVHMALQRVLARQPERIVISPVEGIQNQNKHAPRAPLSNDLAYLADELARLGGVFLVVELFSVNEDPLFAQLAIIELLALLWTGVLGGGVYLRPSDLPCSCTSVSWASSRSWPLPGIGNECDSFADDVRDALLTRGKLLGMPHCLGNSFRGVILIPGKDPL